MLFLALIIAVAGLQVQAAPVAALTVLVPTAGEHGRFEVSLICRDPRGGWNGGETWQPADSPSVKLSGPRDARCRALLRPLGRATYLISDEVRWDPAAGPVSLRPGLLRMIQAPAVDGDPHWLGASGSIAQCDRTPTRIRCLFVPRDEPGVVVSVHGNRTYFALAQHRGSDPVPSELSWRSAPWGRFVRVHIPAGTSLEARVVIVESALRRGKGMLRERRGSTAAQVHAIGGQSLWIEGSQDLAARLDISAAGSATQRLQLDVVKGPPLVPLELSPPPEEVIDGDVRARGVLIEGTVVILARLLGQPSGLDEDDEKVPMELIGEAKTDSAGRFSFHGLSRGRHELLAMHSSRGRARAFVLAPSHSRLVLTPRASLRGRVLSNGVPAAGASISVLPSFDAVADARNPMLLMTEPVRSGVDGRFEAALPEEGGLSVTVVHEGTSARVELGEASTLPPVVDVGDIKLQAPFDVELLADLPPGCTLYAAGPFGEPGMTLVTGVAVAAGRWRLRAPLPGRWFFEASCEGREVGLETPMVQIDRTLTRPVVLRRRR